jgi:DedD protein
MISLPSFFKKNPPEPVQAKIEPGFRSRQSKVALEKEDTLTENPEVQKARHRLIGAGFLLLIAVIGLPKLFDAQPKKINNDVVIKVVQSVTSSPNSSGTSMEEDKPASKLSNDSNSQTNSEKQSSLESANEKVLSQKKSGEDKPEMNTAAANQEKLKSSNENIVSSQSNPKKDSIQTDPGEVVVNSQISASKVDNKSGKFVLQVTSLASKDGVKNVTAKIKELKITTYVVEKKRETPESVVIYFVRAGPFASKDEALSAQKKISSLGMGLSPIIYEINK